MGVVTLYVLGSKKIRSVYILCISLCIVLVIGREEESVCFGFCVQNKEKCVQGLDDTLKADEAYLYSTTHLVTDPGSPKQSTPKGNSQGFTPPGRVSERPAFRL
jgi:hypothetical protein